jgi:hypothetical protein
MTVLVRINSSLFDWSELDLTGLEVIKVKYLGVIMDRRKTWKLHTERTPAKDLTTYILVRTYSMLRSQRLNINNKLTLYKALVRTIMIYASLTWDMLRKLTLETAAPAEPCSALSAILTCTNRSAECTWLSKFLSCTIT